MEHALTPFVLGELKKYCLSPEGAGVLRSRGGVTVLRVRGPEGGSCILKCFENTASSRELENYRILKSCGVPTLDVLGQSGRSILIEDIEASPVFRLGREEDLSDPAAVRAIARWYRALHEGGRAYAREHGSGMYGEWQRFTEEELDAVRERFGLWESPGMRALREHCGELRAIMDAAPKTLTYNDFYYTNMAVARDGSAALMFDYDMLGAGCAEADLKNAAYWFSEENRRLFFEEYGPADEALTLLDEIVSPAVTLSMAMERDPLPYWAREAMSELERAPELIEALLDKRSRN